MRRLHELGWIDSLAWVVMPNHWHWLLQLGETIDRARVMNAAKGWSAREVNQWLGRVGRFGSGGVMTMRYAAMRVYVRWRAM